MMVAPTKEQLELSMAVENWVHYDIEKDMVEVNEDAPEEIKIKFKKYMDILRKRADKYLYI